MIAGRWLLLLLVAGTARGAELPDWALKQDAEAALAAFPDGEMVQILSSGALEVDASGGRDFRFRAFYAVREGRGGAP